MSAIMSETISVRVSEDGSHLTLAGKRFHAVWLRDNMLDASSRSPANGQKLFTLGDFPHDVRLAAARVEQNSVIVEFSPEGINADFPIAWLDAHAYDVTAGDAGRQRGWLPHHKSAWDSAHQPDLTTADFADVQRDPQDPRDRRALADWLAGIQRYGVAKLVGGPVREGALFDAVELFGYVRETNYGRLFEVRTEVNPTNLAFTGLGLQSHADNPYRDPVPTIQVLYCLESSAAGGENMVVDGFKAAQRLRDEDPGGFDALTRHCARWEFSGDGETCLRSRKPMIELAPDGEIISVRFNNRSAAPITDVPFDAMETYYRGYRHFAKIIDDPAMEVVFRLDPGECFVVDNRRVLHARKGYSGQGTRWLQGCYADMDSLNSKLAVLRGEGWAAQAAEMGGRLVNTAVDAFMPLTQQNIVAFLADIFDRRGDEEYLGEPVTMAQHMLQGATLAQQAGCSEQIVVATLLHDVGHFVSEFGTYSPDDTHDRLHEHAGAQVLAPFFPPIVIDCVRYHVAAKRYLCATRPEYLAELSAASVHSLSLQGGPMDAGQVAAFEQLDRWQDIVAVRYFDDAGKEPDMKTPKFADFAPMICRVVDAHLGEGDLPKSA